MAVDLSRLFMTPEAKALGSSRFFYSDAPVATYLPGTARKREQGLISQREAAHHLQAYGGTEAIDWVMDAVGLYSDTAASAPWHLEKDGKALIAERTEDSPVEAQLAPRELVNLLRNPNPFMDYAELMELLVIDLLLVGNAYWLKHRMTEDGKPLALYRLSPSHVKIKPTDDRSGILYFSYQPPGAQDPVNFDPRQILHFKRPNPHNPYYGLGVIKGGGRPFDLEIAITDAQAHYFENKADPSMIVASERRVPRDVFNKLRAQLRARASGTKNAGELLVLEAGLKASTLTPNARDAMYADLADKSRDRVLAMFRAHPKLLGMPSGSDGQDKVQDIRREFDNKALRPFLDKLQVRVAQGITAAWGLDFKIDYRYIMPAEEAIKLSSDLGSVPGIQVKEVRGFLVEAGIIREVSTGDPEIDDLVLNLPGEEAEEDGFEEDGFADRNLPREAGRPPLGENTRAFPRGARVRSPQGKALSIDTLIDRLDSIKPGAKALPEFEDQPKTSIGNKLAREQRPDDSLEAIRTRDVDALATAMRVDLADAAHPLERALLDHVEGKAFNPKDLTKRVRNSEGWQLFQNLIGTVMERYAQQAISTAAVQHGTAGLTADDLDYEAIAREVVYRRGGLRDISANLKSEIVQKVGQAVQDGKSREEVDQIIRQSIDFWRETQSETVALTEATHAYNEGTLAVAEANGYNAVVVSDGHDHDEPCKDADGRVWPISYAREHRLEHPRCRRAFLPVAPLSPIAALAAEGKALAEVDPASLLEGPPEPQPIIVNVAPPEVNVNVDPPDVNVSPPSVTVEAPNVTVEAAEAPQVHTHIDPGAVAVTVEERRTAGRRTIERDADGNMTAIIED